MNMHRIITLASIAGLCLGVAACSESSSTESGGSSTSSAPVSSEWRLASLPADAQGVKAIKDSAAEGDTVTVRGIIGGRIDPLGKESAFFVMVDPAVSNPCVSDGDDHCSTPWDYCCTTPEEVKAGSATVQLVDADGNPLEFDLSKQGIELLDEVIVVGTVAARPTPDVLTIRATGLHRVAQ